MSGDKRDSGFAELPISLPEVLEVLLDGKEDPAEGSTETGLLGTDEETSSPLNESEHDKTCPDATSRHDEKSSVPEIMEFSPREYSDTLSVNKETKKVETSESEMEREKERAKVNTEIDDSGESQEELDEKVKKK